MSRRAWIQTLLLLPFWLAFAIGWYRVLRTWPAADLLRTFRLLIGIAALYGLALSLWIRHNVAIYRRKGPRRNAREAAGDFSRDILGCPVRCAEPQVLAAQHIVVEINRGEKIYQSPVAPPDSHIATHHAHPVPLYSSR